MSTIVRRAAAFASVPDGALSGSRLANQDSAVERKVTGGEPLVRRNAMQLFRGLARHIGLGLNESTPTPNGSQLACFAIELAECGVRRVNVSLDTLDPDKFRAPPRWGDHAKVFSGIAAAKKAGPRVKIDCVALKGAMTTNFLL